MSSTALTRADLASALNREIGLSHRESFDAVEFVIDEICDALARGEPVKISTFGSFRIRDKKPRVGRNLRTLEEVEISGRRVLLFRPSQSLKSRIAGARHENGSGGT